MIKLEISLNDIDFNRRNDLMLTIFNTVSGFEEISDFVNILADNDYHGLADAINSSYTDSSGRLVVPGEENIPAMWSHFIIKTNFPSAECHIIIIVIFMIRILHWQDSIPRAPPLNPPLLRGMMKITDVSRMNSQTPFPTCNVHWKNHRCRVGTISVYSTNITLCC